MKKCDEKVRDQFGSIRSEQGGTTKEGSIGDHNPGPVGKGHGHESIKSAGVGGKEVPGGKGGGKGGY